MPSKKSINRKRIIKRICNDRNFNKEIRYFNNKKNVDKEYLTKFTKYAYEKLFIDDNKPKLIIYQDKLLNDRDRTGYTFGQYNHHFNYITIFLNSYIFEFNHYSKSKLLLHIIITLLHEYRHYCQKYINMNYSDFELDARLYSTMYLENNLDKIKNIFKEYNIDYNYRKNYILQCMKYCLKFTNNMPLNNVCSNEDSIYKSMINHFKLISEIIVKNK